MIQVKRLSTRISLALFLTFFFSAKGIPSECLFSNKVNNVSCKRISKENIQHHSTIEPSFVAYRLAVSGSTERKCRFEPSCSKFLIEAIKEEGLAKGILYGFARAQMKHDNSFNLLPTVLNDGMILVLDPVKNWKQQ